MGRGPKSRVRRGKPKSVSRRGFLKGGAVVGLAGAGALAGLGLEEPSVAAQGRVIWDRETDVVVIGAGAGGLTAGISARELGATVTIVEANFDIGGRAMMSGGDLYLRGGNRLQKAMGIEDSPDHIFADWTRPDNAMGRFNDRELARTHADHSVEMFDFFERNGVKFTSYRSEPDRLDRIPGRIGVKPWPNEITSPATGSGVVRPLANAARRMGVEILLQHRMTAIHRENLFSGRVTGITAVEVDDNYQAKSRSVKIRARKGIIIATGGCAGNPQFRTMFDVRLTEEYQAENSEWTQRTADGEIAAMAIGAALGATALETTRNDNLITKGRLGKKYNGIGTQVYVTSPHFFRARAVGLPVGDYQDLILVKENGLRFFDETAENRNLYPGRFGHGGTNSTSKDEIAPEYDWNAAALAWTGDPKKLNGGGPIWAIFDSGAVVRERWQVAPPHVDVNGYFFSADTIGELAAKIVNEYQWRPMPGETLRRTVERYNSFVDSGIDTDFQKPTPMHKIEKPPFYAAWATPCLHDSYTGIRINAKAQVIDVHGNVIVGLYACGDSAGGFGQHGIVRAATMGRIGGLHAAKS